jgi:hypothetical protein
LEQRPAPNIGEDRRQTGLEGINRNYARKKSRALMPGTNVRIDAVSGLELTTSKAAEEDPPISFSMSPEKKSVKHFLNDCTANC